jgi:hypothetical protein
MTNHQRRRSSAHFGLMQLTVEIISIKNQKKVQVLKL